MFEMRSSFPARDANNPKENIGHTLENERKFEVIEKARKQVEIAAYFDAYLLSGKDLTWRNFLESLESKESMSEGLSERLKNILETWVEQSVYRNGQNKEIHERAEKKYGNDSSENVSKTVFEALWKGKRKSSKSAPELAGEIEIKSDHPFFIFYYNEPHDYYLIVDNDSGGTFHAAGRTKMDFDEDEINGFNEKTIFPPILMINGTEKCTETVLHESQHFINKNWSHERKGGSKLDLAQYRIKDEILANMRGGRLPLDIIDALDTESYEYHYKNLDQSNIAKLKQIRNLICEALQEAVQFFSTQDARTLLIYHLLDVPFNKMESRIRLLTEFEKSKGNTARQFVTSVKKSKWFLEPTNTEFIPPPPPPREKDNNDWPHDYPPPLPILPPPLPSNNDWSHDYPPPLD